VEELNLWALAAKVAGAALVVVLAARWAERAGPFFGAMIATLPVSTGPIYAFLAIDHGAAFIAQAAVMSVASTAAIVAFVAGHALAAQRLATAGSLAVATATWFAVALLLQLRAWSFAEAALLLAASFALAMRGLRRFAVAIPPAAGPRARFDLPLRVMLVATLVIATSVASRVLGPSVTGLLAAYPVVFTSLVVILQPRTGGAFVSSVLVNGLKGLLGFGTALAVVHVGAPRFGSAAALVLALAVAVGWNATLVLWRRYSAAMRLASSSGSARSRSDEPS
jgi:hypothetical protein